jgi:hypothetical protein
MHPTPFVELLEPRQLLAADPVLAWNEVLLDAVRRDRTPPPVAARAMAMVHIAIADAIALASGNFDPLLARRNDSAKRDVSLDAAAAAAAHDVLVSVFPAQADIFNAELSTALAAIPDGKAEKSGISLGRHTAKAVLHDRKHDGSNANVPYTIGDQPGEWQPTPPAFAQVPLLAHWGHVEPFAIESGAQFRPPPPPALTSAQYTAAFNEVKELGSVTSTTRTADQTQIAQFWADGAGTATPPGHWNEIAQDVAVEQGNTVAENARLFALLNVALSDAAISCWDAKYVYDLWRPVTAIRAADTDGNPATLTDATWTPLIATPPFPAYTSGHSTFSAAAAAVLASFYGTDDVHFVTSTDDLPGVTRAFDSFSDAAAEAGMSRIYGGIHWSFDNTAAQPAGAAIAQYVVHHILQPNENRQDNNNPRARPSHKKRGDKPAPAKDLLT